MGIHKHHARNAKRIFFVSIIVWVIVAGILLSVTDGAVSVRTSPSYGPPEDVIVRTPIIAYVRLEG